MATTIYKIMSEDAWRAFEKDGNFAGAAIDLTDGFIHFSTANQMRQTAALHFAGKSGLYLVAVDTAPLGAALKFEPSRGGDLFPHLFGSLSLEHVVWAKPLPLDANGMHVFPEAAQ